ncbi:MAG: phosphatase PAP2 family protein [Mycobacteriales bacterium]
MAVPTLRRAPQPRPEVDPPTPRPRAWREFLLVAVLYMAYDGTRLLAKGGDTRATRHGHDLLRAEQYVHLDWERWLNRMFGAHASLAIPGDYAYAILHYAVTPVVLIWLFRRHPVTYLRARTVLAVATLIALLGFWLLPTAPPRLLGAGFVDTMSQHANVGWWGADASAPKGMGGMTNEVAAFPSMHVGWALWCGYYLYRRAGRRWLRALGVAYPIVMAIVVMGTGNHYFFDALAGCADVIAVGLVVRMISTRRLTGGRLLSGRQPRAERPPGTEPAAPRPPEPRAAPR